MERRIPVGISNRHIHLSKNHLEILYGKGYCLNKLKDLSQPNQFAAKETLSIIGPKGKIDKVRILGPIRKKSQVEISRGDSFILGLNPPLRESGHLENSASCILVGPNGQVSLEEGVILAARHLHVNIEEANQLNLTNNDRISLKSFGERSIIFNNVIVRIDPNFKCEAHVDIEEGNAANLKTGDLLEII